MKKSIIRTILLLCYCIPFVFLAMNEDVISGTLWFYLVMIVGLGALCIVSVKSNNSWIVIVGNILSVASSCIFTYFFRNEKWGWYFKPFTPYQCIIFEAVFAFVIQMVIFFMLKEKKNK